MKCPECGCDIPMPEWLKEALDELAGYRTVNAIMDGEYNSLSETKKEE